MEFPMGVTCAPLMYVQTLTRSAIFRAGVDDLAGWAFASTALRKGMSC
jgi:hypothetical protein